MIRVVIADDHRLMREGLQRLVSAEPGMAVVGEACNDIEVLSQVRRGGFDVLMLDLSMPGRSGIELIRRVRSEAPDLGILVLTMHDEQHYAVRAVSAGAQGYLTKENAAAEVIEAICHIASGRPYIGRKVAEELALSVMDPCSGALHSKLSNRELQIFSFIVKGDSLSVIGAELNVSVKTVSAHKARILQKMGMGSFSELVQYAIAHNMLPPLGNGVQGAAAVPTESGRQ